MSVVLRQSRGRRRGGGVGSGRRERGFDLGYRLLV